jgi:hypothetical protein
MFFSQLILFHFAANIKYRAVKQLAGLLKPFSFTATLENIKVCAAMCNIRMVEKK